MLASGSGRMLDASDGNKPAVGTGIGDRTWGPVRARLIDAIVILTGVLDIGTVGLVDGVEGVDKPEARERLSHDGWRKGRCAYVRKTV